MVVRGGATDDVLGHVIASKRQRVFVMTRTEIKILVLLVFLALALFREVGSKTSS